MEANVCVICKVGSGVPYVIIIYNISREIAKLHDLTRDLGRDLYALKNCRWEAFSVFYGPFSITDTSLLGNW